MANYYNTTTAAQPVEVSRSSDTHTVRAMWLNGSYLSIQQKVTTVVQRYEGIGYNDAVALCVSSETSTLPGTSTARNHLGGAKAEAANHSWIYADACWGTQTAGSMNAMSPNMYEVTVTTTTLEVFVGSDLTLTLT